MKKKLIVGALMSLSILSTAAAQSLSIGFEPNKPRYARGEWITVRVTLRNYWGIPVANTPIQVGDKWDLHPSFRWTTYFTNYADEVVLPYQVPLNPNRDNVYIGAKFDSWGIFNQRRIPIGL